MRVQKLILLTTVFLIILSSPVLADINLNIITDDFYLSPGSYSLEIQVERGGNYGITALGPYRSWVTFENPYVSVRNSAEVNFSITPPKGTKAGKYRFPIMIYSLQNESLYMIKKYELIIEEKAEVKITDLDTNKAVFSPGDKIMVKATTRNTGTSDFGELKLYIKMKKNDYEVVREKTFSLNIDEERSFNETFDTSFHLDPGTYEIQAKLFHSGKEMSSKKRLIEIKTIGKIEKKHTSSWNLLQESGKFYLTNVGNVKKEEKISMEITKPWDWFVFFSEMPEITDMGSYILYTWDVSLKPGENKTIIYEIHYWPFIIIVLVLLYGLYLALKHIKTPSIKKYSIQTKVLEDDRREVMVAIEVKSGAKKMKDVIVEDRVPSVAQLIKDFKTKKPKLVKTDTGIIMKWKLGDLDRNENIILTYRLRTVIGTVGYLKLPKAILKAKINKVRNEYFSNSLKIRD